MKISLTLQIAADDDSANDTVLQNLLEMGFVDTTNAEGARELSYEGEISMNDVAYGAPMFRSMRGR